MNRTYSILSRPTVPEPSIVSLYYWKIILIKQKIKGKIDSTGRFINNLRTKEEDDDAWSLEDDNEEYFERNKTKQNSFKLKFDKFINMLPLTTTTPKHTNEELEMAEKMAAMIVQDVVNQNNHLIFVQHTLNFQIHSYQ